MTAKSNARSIDIIGLGWLGLPLAIHLQQHGYEVSGTTTSVEKLSDLRKLGLNVRLHRLGQEVYSTTADTVLINIPSKDITGFTQLAKELSLSCAKHVIFIGSTSVYDSNAGKVTADNPVIDHPLITIEDLFKQLDAVTCVLRFAGLIGNQRRPGRFFKGGRAIPNPEGRVNMIHLSDCIGIIHGLLEKKWQNVIFNAAADQHPVRRTYYTTMFAQESRAAPIFEEGAPVHTKVIDNTAIKNYLGYKFKYPDPLLILNYDHKE